jgi:predicted AlkP superfamily phosphohydrolase/phosphomutase
VSAVTQFAGAIDWANTTAYGVHLFHPYFGIELNVRGRQAEGRVEPGDVERVRASLVAGLRSSARDLGLPIRSVATREETYGPGADPRLPDIVLRFEDDAEGVNDVAEPLVAASAPAGRHETKSYHSPDGILVLAGAGVRPGRSVGVRLEDLAPTILGYLGVAPHPKMTGRVLFELFEPAALPQPVTPSVPGSAELSDPDARAPISDGEEREIVAALRGLGYLE